MIKKAQPLVTIAIPTYNRANGYLGKALASTLKQTYQNIEIIVSDNCSTDNTETFVKGFSDPRIRYFKQAQNIGANNNFNFCVEQARGDYFVLLHDDDLIDHNFVDVCMNAVNDDVSIGIIRTGTRIIDQNGTVLSETTNRVGRLSMTDFFLGWFANKTSLYLCSTLFNTKRLKEIGGFQSKTNLFQDVVATVQLATKFGRVDIRDIKASFRRHSDNRGSAVKIEDWCEDCLYLLDIMCDLASEKRAQVRSKGMPYFCKKNYRHTARIKSPMERFRSYLMVYKKFNYCYSPVHFLYSRYVRPRKNSLLRRARQMFRRPQAS